MCPMQATPALVTSLFADWLEAYFYRARDRTTVAFALVPLVLIYGLGLLTAEPWARSGVDLLSGELLTLFGTGGYVAVQVGLALVLIAYGIDQRTELVRTHLRVGLLSLVESCLWGISLGVLVLTLMQEAHLLTLGDATFRLGMMERVVIAAGAGLHEELIFRVALHGLFGVLLAHLIGLSRQLALVGAVILSALLFATAHHLAGEPFSTYVFFFRLTAGLLFSLLYLTRGLGIAAWTHAIYDFSVL